MDFFRDQWTSSGSKLSWKTINNCFASNNTFNACDGSGQCRPASQRHWRQDGIRVWDNRYSGERTVPLHCQAHITHWNPSSPYHRLKVSSVTWRWLIVFFVSFCSDDTNVLIYELGGLVCVLSSSSQFIFTTQTRVKKEKETHVVKLLWNMKYLIWNLLQRFDLKQTHKAT